MSASQLNKKRLIALLLAAALMVPLSTPARAETVGPEPPAQETVGTPPVEVPSVPPEVENPVIPPVDSPVIPPSEGSENSSVPLADDDVALKAVTLPEDELLTPQVTPDQIPAFELEARVITDAFGVPNGFVELLVKVTTPGIEQMQSLALSLQYSDELEPANWSGGNITMGSVDFATYIPAKHPSSMTSAEAYGDSNRHLYIYAESSALPELTGGETVAAVRFHCKNPLIYKDGEIVKVTNADYDPTDPATATTTESVTLFQWNSDTVAASTPKSRQALWYASKDSMLYHVPAYNSADPDTFESVALTVGGGTINIDKPKTAGATILAVKAGIPTDYSYLSNHVPAANIDWTEAEGQSFDNSGSGITLDDVATVVFFDWDDTFLGATAVARGIDNRKVINDFVLNTMVHPKLRTNKNYSSLDRTDTYRGEYPCIDPNSGETVADGESYPLTNKLDYAFYKKVVEVKNGTAEITAPSDDKFPYIHGWQSVTPQNMSDTWTALEANQAVPSADFKKITEDVVYVKALYEPGTGLNTGVGDAFYSISENAEYGVYGSITATSGVYSIRFQYKRINESGNGVRRIKEPALQLSLTPDVPGAQSFYLGMDLKNTDTINVDILAEKNLKTIDYRLMDAYQSNVVEGGVASKSGAADKLGTFFNQGASGEDGFVKYGTVAFITEQAYMQNAGSPDSQWGSVTYLLLNDAGLKRLADGSTFTNAVFANQAKTKILSCIRTAIAQNESEVTYYQLQYQVIQNTYADAQTAKIYCQANYPWCK